MGGAIRGGGNTSIIIKSSEISSNTGAHMGAGVYSDGRLEIYDSKITNNTAQRSAGVFYNGNYFYMENTEVSSNKATSGTYYNNAAGGVWIQNAKKAVIKNCIFTENVSGSNSGDDGLSNYDKTVIGGGAMLIQDSIVTLEDCIFQKNESNNPGGAIVIVTKSSQNYTTLTTLNCTFGTGSLMNYLIHSVDAKVRNDYCCIFFHDESDPEPKGIKINGAEHSAGNGNF